MIIIIIEILIMICMLFRNLPVLFTTDADFYALMVVFRYSSSRRTTFYSSFTSASQTGTWVTWSWCLDLRYSSKKTSWKNSFYSYQFFTSLLSGDRGARRAGANCVPLSCSSCSWHRRWLFLVLPHCQLSVIWIFKLAFLIDLPIVFCFNSQVLTKRIWSGKLDNQDDQCVNKVVLKNHNAQWLQSKMWCAVKSTVNPCEYIYRAIIHIIYIHCII